MKKLIGGAALLALFVVMTQSGARAQASPTELGLLSRISQQPAEVSNYLELATYYRGQNRLAEAEQLLVRALELLREELRTGQRPVTGRPSPQGAGGDAYGAPVRVGGDVREPKKIRDVKPYYPPEAQAAGVQGIVIMEAVIDRDGYVRDARVLRSVPILDQAATDAVRQWQFTPTLLNGVPVEVIMTVTVNFTLG
jgi:TonB family protein